MGRAAGSGSHYTFKLSGGRGEISLVSVTTVLGAVLKGSFGPASYWGYKLGIQAAGGDPAALKDSEFSPNKVKDTAALRGTGAHDVLEHLVRGDQPFDAEAMTLDGLKLTKWERGVAKWWIERGQSYLSDARPEQAVWSLKKGYAGTADLLNIFGDRLSLVVDLKTHSGRPRFDDLVQTAFYAVAAREMYGLDGPTNQLVVCAHEDGNYVESRHEDQVDEAVVDAILAVYWEMKR